MVDENPLQGERSPSKRNTALWNMSFWAGKENRKSPPLKNLKMEGQEATVLIQVQDFGNWDGGWDNEKKGQREWAEREKINQRSGVKEDL